ncbi:MAG: hypothetical protein ACOYOP_08840 [Microthrixaceae bacterium]
MTVCTFKEGTAMDEVAAVIPEEQARVATLTDEGRVGSIHLSLARGTVFIETFAEDVDDAATTVRTLPMARWWDLDVFPLAPPMGPGAPA